MHLIIVSAYIYALACLFFYPASTYTLLPSPSTQSSLGNEISSAFAMGLAHHMNSDQLPPAKLWGPELLQPFGDQPCGCDQRVTAAKGYHVGKNHPGWWGSQLGGRSWQRSLPGNGAKVGWPQLQGLLGSKSELGTMNQPPWLPAQPGQKGCMGTPHSSESTCSHVTITPAPL